ncbi:MAG: zinc ribbon domain-containing protein [Dehalococcoidia bacterium]|nr:zinc ribbon domain-containing protein [Dehalococcoidia bacterium]
MPKQIPVPNELNKPFWDACNQQKLVVQRCANCNTLHYPPKQKCDKCSSAAPLGWKEVKGSGHILEYFVIRDSRIRRLQADQPLNLAVVTLDEDPGLNFLSNLPGIPAGEVPVGAAVEVLFEPVEGSDQLIPEWRVPK